MMIDFVFDFPEKGALLLITTVLSIIVITHHYYTRWRMSEK